jgi:hypothetical protein
VKCCSTSRIACRREWGGHVTAGQQISRLGTGTTDQGAGGQSSLHSTSNNPISQAGDISRRDEHTQSEAHSLHWKGRAGISTILIWGPSCSCRLQPGCGGDGARPVGFHHLLVLIVSWVHYIITERVVAPVGTDRVAPSHVFSSRRKACAYRCSSSCVCHPILARPASPSCAREVALPARALEW